MPAEDDKSSASSPGAHGKLVSSGGAALSTAVDFYGLGTVKVYAILEHEMTALNAASGRASTLLAFFCGCMGVFLCAVLSALVALPSGATAAAVYIAVCITFGIASAVLGVLWLVASRERTTTLSAIKERAAQPQRYLLAPPELQTEKQ